MRKLLLIIALLPLAMLADPVNFGGLREGDMIETNGVPVSRTITVNGVTGELTTNLVFAVAGGIAEEFDPLAYPVATNALALAEVALLSAKYYGDVNIRPSPTSWFTFTETGSGITGLSETGANKTVIVIPYSANGIAITEIRNNAFYACSGITSIEIPNSVTDIWNGVFYGCSSLTYISIPRSVTSIGYGVFHDNSSLNSVIVADKDYLETDFSSLFEGTPATLKIYATHPDASYITDGGTWPIEIDGKEVVIAPSRAEITAISESLNQKFPKSGGTLTGGLTLAPAGISWPVAGTNLTYTVKAEYDGTNINFNVYEVLR